MLQDEIIYEETIAALKRFKIPLEGVPKLDNLRVTLEDNIKMEAMGKRSFLLIPPIPRQELIKLFNAEKGGRHKTHLTEFDNDNLWGKDSKEWRAMVVDGISEVQGRKRGDWGQQAKEWQQEADDRGVHLINDSQTYIILFMLTYHQNDPIDQNGHTLIQLHHTLTSHRISSGDSWLGQVSFETSAPGNPMVNLYARASIHIKF